MTLCRLKIYLAVPMFGLLAIFAITVYVCTLLLPLIAVIVSGVNCRRIPLYWYFAIVSAVAFPIVFRPSLPERSGGEYGAFFFFVKGAFSGANFVYMVGAGAAMLCSFQTKEPGRWISGVSWGFLSMAVIRTIKLV